MTETTFNSLYILGIPTVYYTEYSIESGEEAAGFEDTQHA